MQEAEEHQTADERFAALRDRLAEQRQTDAAVALAKRREAKQAKREKLRAAAGDTGSAAGVQLAGGSDSGSDSDEHAERTHGAGGGGNAANSDAAAYRGMLASNVSSSDSDLPDADRGPEQQFEGDGGGAEWKLDAGAGVVDQEALVKRLLAARGL